MPETDEFSPDITRLVSLLTGARHTVAFTGAGISTLSGIQDFRGKNGLYKVADANAMFDIDRFRQDPSLYYTMAKDFIYGLDEKKPSTVHTVLAGLEERGYLAAVITQNIDLLHQKAGSRTVFEIHGTPAVHRCLSCGSVMTFAEAAVLVKKGEIPRCPDCSGTVKPDITFFGEMLPQEAVQQAKRHAREADLMLILGTSLAVYPAASLPELTLHNGGKLVIVNDMPTHLDRYAELHFSDLQTTFSALEKALLSN